MGRPALLAGSRESHPQVVSTRTAPNAPRAGSWDARGPVTPEGGPRPKMNWLAVVSLAFALAGAPALLVLLPLLIFAPDRGRTLTTVELACGVPAIVLGLAAWITIRRSASPQRGLSAAVGGLLIGLMWILPAVAQAIGSLAAPSGPSYGYTKPVCQQFDPATTKGILATCAGTNADGSQVVLRITTAQPLTREFGWDPEFDLSLTGRDGYDYVVLMLSDGASMYKLGGINYETICRGTINPLTPSREHVIAFDASCIGSPPQLWWQALIPPQPWWQPAVPEPPQEQGVGGSAPPGSEKWSGPVTFATKG